MTHHPSPAPSCTHRVRRNAALALIGLLVLSSGSGCRSWQALARKTNPPAFQPVNHFAQFEKLPAFVRRVAVLPIHVPTENFYATDSRSQLEPVFFGELGKLNRFELKAVTEEQLRAWTGREQWAAQDPLPQDFFQRLRKETECDAVLFTQVSSYRPYRPMVVGWNLRLIDARLRSVLWGAEEVFDSGQLDVSVAAQRYYEEQSSDAKDLGDSERILLSPSRFNQYTIHAILASLPPR